MRRSSSEFRVVFTVTNCICFDQRVQKMAETVSRLGCDITIAGRELGDCCKTTVLPFRTVRFRMIFKRGLLFYKFINIRILFHLLFHRYDLIVANDLDTLLPCYIISKLKGTKLVFDSHEYFPGVPELNGKPLRKWFWKKLEASMVPHIENIITVSDPIADIFKNEYGVNPVVIRNLARSSSAIVPLNRSELGCSEDSLVLIMQGGGINIDKGAEELLEAVREVPGIFLIIAGAGDVYENLRQYSNTNNMSGKVKFVPKISWNELMRYTKAADAGLSLEKDTNLNYRFSLPNKLFDYISAGIPVIAGSLPEVRKVIEDNDCGLIIREITPDNIRNAIIKLRDDRILLNKLKANAVRASQSLNWETETVKVEEFYKPLVKQC